MIQRKQTVFLLLAAIALGLLFYFPLATFIGDKDSLVLYVYKLVSLVPDNAPDVPAYFLMPLLSLNVLMILLSVVIIFMFKNRMRQLNFVRINLILLMIMIAVFFFYDVSVLEEASGGVVEYEVGSYFPLIAFIFFILAYKGIMSDERLIRSADRLR
jgi:predicted cation transporter